MLLLLFNYIKEESSTAVKFSDTLNSVFIKVHVKMFDRKVSNADG